MKPNVKIFLLCLAVFILPIALAFLTRPIIVPSLLWTAPHNLDATLFWTLRLPRQILAVLIGAALSLSGVSFQSILRNPLADPYILGVSGGAALGYVLAVALGLPLFLQPIAGFALALTSLLGLYRLASSEGVLATLNLLLIGVIFNSFSFAIILVINALANFGQAHQILNLLLGSLDSYAWPRVALMAIFTLVSGAILFSRADRLNALSLGDEDAFHLGVNVEREKRLVFILTSLLVGASVSLCGLIGFVGLFVPHLTRLIVGADHRRLLPAAALFGGLFLSMSDFLACHLLSWDTLHTTLPVGVITALIGAPVFVWMVRKNASGRLL